MSDNGRSSSRTEAESLAQPDTAAAPPVAAPGGTEPLALAEEPGDGDGDAPPRPTPLRSPSPGPRHRPAEDADDGRDAEGGIRAERGKPKLAEDAEDGPPPPHPTQLGGAAAAGPAPAAKAKAAVKTPELMEEDDAPAPAGHDLDEEEGGVEDRRGKLELAEGGDDDEPPPPHPAQWGGEYGPAHAAKAAVASPGFVKDDEDASAPEGPTMVAPADEPQERAALPPLPSPTSAAVPIIFRPPPPSMLPPPNEDPQENDEPPSHQPRAPSILQLEVVGRLVESDEEATVYSAVQMTPTRWEQHKKCIIAVFAIFFVGFVVLTVSLLTQGGGGNGDVQADPSPLFGDCSNRVKERRTDCGGGSSSAECKQFVSGGCGPQEREESPFVEQEWDCRSSGAMTVCTFDVKCCRTTSPPDVAATTPPAGPKPTIKPTEASLSSTAPIMRQTSKPTEDPSAKPKPAPPASPSAGQPRPSLRPTKAPASTNATIPWDALAAAEWAKRGGDLVGEAASDRSGHSVALSSDGTVLAVGAIHNNGAGNNAGHVRVFGLDASTNEWVQLGDDIDGEAANDQSGFSVALSSDGTVLAVGADGNNGVAGDYAGHVRVHEWDATAAKWVRRGDDLDGEGSGDRSGSSVALSSDGTVLAVGAPYNNGSGDPKGHVRVYAWDAPAAKWVRRGDDLDGEAADDESGFSVSLSSDGTVLAIGARYNDGAGSNAGHVRVYAWDAPAAEWVRRGNDLDGEAADDESGFSVALSSDGSVLAVGARTNDGAGSNAGHVRVYAWDAPAAEWVQRGEDLDGEARNDRSGYSVALSGDGTVLAVGARYNDGADTNAGHVRVYTWDAPAAKWVQRGDDLDGEARRDWSGFSVALSSDGTILAVGAPYNDNAGDDAGLVSVYAWQVPNRA